MHRCNATLTNRPTAHRITKSLVQDQRVNKLPNGLCLECCHHALLVVQELVDAQVVVVAALLALDPYLVAVELGQLPSEPGVYCQPYLLHQVALGGRRLQVYPYRLYVALRCTLLASW